MRHSKSSFLKICIYFITTRFFKSENPYVELKFLGAKVEILLFGRFLQWRVLDFVIEGSEG